MLTFYLNDSGAKSGTNYLEIGQDFPQSLYNFNTENVYKRLKGVFKYGTTRRFPVEGDSCAYRGTSLMRISHPPRVLRRGLSYERGTPVKRVSDGQRLE